VVCENSRPFKTEFKHLKYVYMIILPSRRKLQRRISQEYNTLLRIINHATVQQVEAHMRRIHLWNIKLKAYGTIQQKEPEEIFEQNDSNEKG
jgi:vacuolar-type H+-ATPase subunit C/Vma6